MIASQDDSACGPMSGFTLQDSKAGFEEMVEECAFASVLCSYDGDGEVVLIT